MKPERLRVLLTAVVAIVGVLFGSVAFGAAPEVVDFEGFDDLTVLTTQLPGLTFTNATVLTAGISLNELEAPPHSGANVISDEGGAVVIEFSTPVSQVGGFFTYAFPVTITAFHGLVEVASTTSSFATNFALSGDIGSSPNEFLGVTSTSGITRVVIQGDPFGFSFVLDDLTFTITPTVINHLVSFVPLPSTYTTTANTTGCPSGFVGKFQFQARLTNKSTSPPLTNLAIQVKTLTNNNLLQNADGGPGGVGATLTVPENAQFADGILDANEFADVPFVICLKQRTGFTFLVDVLGVLPML